MTNLMHDLLPDDMRELLDSMSNDELRRYFVDECRPSDPEKAALFDRLQHFQTRQQIYHDPVSRDILDCFVKHYSPLPEFTWEDTIVNIQTGDVPGYLYKQSIMAANAKLRGEDWNRISKEGEDFLKNTLPRYAHTGFGLGVVQTWNDDEIAGPCFSLISVLFGIIMADAPCDWEQIEMNYRVSSQSESDIDAVTDAIESLILTALSTWINTGRLDGDGLESMYRVVLNKGVELIEEPYAAIKYVETLSTNSEECGKCEKRSLCPVYKLAFKAFGEDAELRVNQVENICAGLMSLVAAVNYGVIKPEKLFAVMQESRSFVK